MLWARTRSDESRIDGRCCGLLRTLVIAEIVQELRMKGLNSPVGRKGTAGGLWMIDVVGIVDGYEGSAGWSGRGARCLGSYGVGEDKRKKKTQCRKA